MRNRLPVDISSFPTDNPESDPRYLFSRAVGDRVVCFFRDDGTPGVHIIDSLATVSGDSTAEMIDQAIGIVYEHKGIERPQIGGGQ